NGIDVFRIFDAMNDVRNLETAIRAVKKAGKHAQGTICYTTSPVHTTEAFVAQAQTIADMGVDSIAIKDMAGLLTPYATGALVKALKNALPQLEVVVHSHDTAGVAACVSSRPSRTVPIASIPPSPAWPGAPAIQARNPWLPRSRAASTTPALISS